MSPWLVAVGAIGVHSRSLADNHQTLHANSGVYLRVKMVFS